MQMRLAALAACVVALAVALPTHAAAPLSLDDAFARVEQAQRRPSISITWRAVPAPCPSTTPIFAPRLPHIPSIQWFVLRHLR